jgi:hypothetical protein
LGVDCAIVRALVLLTRHADAVTQFAARALRLVPLEIVGTRDSQRVGARLWLRQQHEDDADNDDETSRVKRRRAEDASTSPTAHLTLRVLSTQAHCEHLVQSARCVTYVHPYLGGARWLRALLTPELLVNTRVASTVPRMGNASVVMLGSAESGEPSHVLQVRV